jgi:hypothetical protein
MAEFVDPHDREEEQGKRRTRKWYFWFTVTSVVTLVMLYFFYYFPGTGIGPEQPIPFSHRVHAGVKAINCRFCHPFVERSEHAGLPTVEKCFYCHKYIIPMHPQILKEKRHLETKTPVPWVRIFFVPDFVKFWHMPHIRWAKLDCAECHGTVQEMDRLRSVDFQMGFCLDCHKRKNAQTDCWLACHH